MRKACLFTAVLCAFLGGASAQSPQLLNNFDSGTEGWFQNFGTINIVSASGGLLTWVSPGGTSGAISDSFNNTNALFQPNAGGVDLTGMSSLNFHLGYTGSDPTIDVQFFVQASPSSTYVALGPDQTVSAGAKNLIFSAPLSGLTPEQIAYIRTWGINIRSHSADANFSLGFVSSSGTPLFSRQFATFEPGTPDGEFNSAIVNFDGAGVQGNSGQNNSGLSVVGGSLQWLDLGGGPGGAISIFNGFNTGFNGRPTDLSNYDYIHWAISGDEGVVKTISPVNLQFFLQTTNGFTYSVLGPDQSFTPDGTLYSFYAPLGNVGNTDFVQTIGMNVAGHPQDITFSVDFIEAGQAFPYSFSLPPSSSGTVSRLQLNGSNLELIQEPTGTPLFSIPAALVNPITITGVADQDDMLIIDYSNAAFGNISVNFLGGDGGNDSLEFIGAGYPAAEYHVSDGMNGSGGILLNGGTIVFTGLEPVTMSGIGVIDFETPANEDDILVDSPGAGQNRVSGTSNGGVPFEALTFYDVTTFILDTGFNDVTAPNDVVVIDPAGLVASNLVDFQILTGEGDDIVNGQGAIATSATLTVNAGPGVDSVTGTFDADIILSGPGNDTLVGSRGNDQIFGEEDNDTLIWNNGDNTDLMEGGPGDDVVLVNGAPAAGDHFKMRPNGMRFDFDRINLIPFTLDIGTSETLDVNGLGGDDIFDVTASADLFIDLDGFGHVTGDTLNVDAQGQSVMVSKGVFPLPNGTIQVDSLQPIVYSNMEDVNILNQLAPTETETSVPTQTETPLPPTATETLVPPTATETLVPPTATSTETEIPTSTETEVPSPTPTNTFGPVVQAATLTISCSCTIGIYGGPDPFHIRIVGGTLPEADPPAVSCEVFNSLVDCQIDCSAETGFGCDVVLGNVTRQIINCINTQAAGVVVGVTVAG
ncbi:MAG: hypothetical protein HUU16_15400, partial [Candidatus Omnitrophica bacterium]|nr:hypothetical protein [Candidatus Omnitrophota bacterium]